MCLRVCLFRTPITTTIKEEEEEEEEEEFRKNSVLSSSSSSSCRNAACARARACVSVKVQSTARARLCVFFFEERSVFVCLFLKIFP